MINYNWKKKVEWAIEDLGMEVAGLKYMIKNLREQLDVLELQKKDQGEGGGNGDGGVAASDR